MEEQISTKRIGSNSDSLSVTAVSESGRLADIGRLFQRRYCLKSTIQVYASTEPEPFVVHKDILCASSCFFKKACQKPWKESEGVVELPTTNPRLFEVYAGWLYSSDVLSSMDKSLVVTTADGEASAPAFEPLFHLYALGDMLQDSSFKNTILNKIVEVCYTTHFYPTTFAAFVYSELPPSSPLRRLYVDLWVCQSNETWFHCKDPAEDCNSPDAPMEFFRDVLKRSKSNGDRKKPWLKDICQYHEHGEGIKCMPLDLDQK